MKEFFCCFFFCILLHVTFLKSFSLNMTSLLHMSFFNQFFICSFISSCCANMIDTSVHLRSDHSYLLFFIKSWHVGNPWTKLVIVWKQKDSHSNSNKANLWCHFFLFISVVNIVMFVGSTFYLDDQCQTSNSKCWLMWYLYYPVEVDRPFIFIQFAGHEINSMYEMNI